MEYSSFNEYCVLKKENVYTLLEAKEREKNYYLPKIIVTVISFEDTMSGPSV
jgi:hypothetical protein